MGAPQVAYKETVKATAEGEGKYIKQSGGRGQYGHCWLRIAPKNRGEGFEFIDEIKGGIIPREYIPAIEKGIKEAIANGVVAGYPMVDLSIAVFDGSYHEVDSSEAAFKMAAILGFKEAARKAKPILLEPIMKIEITTPEEYMGEVIGDLNSKRAVIKEMKDRAKTKIIDGEVPLSAMFSYATTIRSLSQGRASFNLEFSHYQEAPLMVVDKILESRGLEKK